MVDCIKWIFLFGISYYNLFIIMNKKTNSLSYGNLASASLVWLDYHKHKEQQLAAQQKLQDAKDKAEASKSEKSVDGKGQDAKQNS